MNWSFSLSRDFPLQAKLGPPCLGLGLGLTLGSGLPVALINPALNLNFLVGTLDPRITFTRGSTATYVDATGLIATAAIDAARFDYNPATLAPKGLLLEEQRTNIALQSGAIDSSPTWVNNGNQATITPNNVVSPTGATDADTIAGTLSGSGVYQGVPTVSATTYTVSLFEKAVGGATASRTGNDANPAARISLETATGVISAPTGSVIASSSTSYPNAWHRATVAYTATGTVNVPFAYTNVASAMSFSAWGFQVEAGAFATSYIPTTTVAVTRSADSAVMTGANFSSWFNPVEGTFVVTATSPASGNRTIFAVDDNTSNETIILQSQGTALHLIVIDGGVTVCDITLGTITAHTSFTAAFRYKANDVAGSLNGAAVVTDTSVTLPTVDQMRLGASQAGAMLCGCLESQKYYLLAAPDGLLRSLST